MRVLPGYSKYFILVLFCTVTFLQSCKKKAQELSDDELAEAISDKSNFQDLTKLAKESGIDVAKFQAEGKSQQVFALLEEIGFGHKPQLRFVQKVVKADTNVIRTAARMLYDGESAEKAMEKLEPVFPVYNNLKVNYTRLVQAKKNDSAAYVADAMNAYRWIHRQTKGAPRFVLVNIRGAYLTAMDSAGKNVLTMRTVVGKNDTQTPTIDTYATSIVTHPYWNVPKSIAIKEMFPKASSDPEYLTKNRIEVINKKGEVVNPEDIDWEEYTADRFPYRFRQDTGGDNSLGLLKVEIKNPLAIYLHDTNARYLFNLKERWRSHGCVRVQHPTDLANYMAGTELLQSDFLTEPDSVSTPPQWHKLKVRIPVFLLYMSADCNEKGDLLYFPDVYKRGSPKPLVTSSKDAPANKAEVDS